MDDEKRKYHDHLSDSLGIDNDFEPPDRQDGVVVRRKLPEPELFSEDNNVTPTQCNRVEIVPHSESIKDAERDYREVRCRLHQLAEAGQTALEGILAVAEESEHPRAYEVVATLIKTLSENSKQLMELHHSTHDLEEKKNKAKENAAGRGQNNNVTNNNAIFVGSTAEFQKMIDEMGVSG